MTVPYHSELMRNSRGGARATDRIYNPVMRRPWLAVIAAFLCAASLAAQTSGRRRAVGSPPPTLGQWIAARGIPFATVEPVDDDSDLLPLRAIVGDAAYVGVGEATHGSHEFFAMKHRLFRFLVERMGFTVFSIEASLPECDKINDFVQTITVVGSDL